MKNKNEEVANGAIQTVKKLYEMLVLEAKEIAVFDCQKKLRSDIFDAPVCYEMYPSKKRIELIKR